MNPERECGLNIWTVNEVLILPLIRREGPVKFVKSHDAPRQCRDPSVPVTSDVCHFRALHSHVQGIVPGSWLAQMSTLTEHSDSKVDVGSRYPQLVEHKIRDLTTTRTRTGTVLHHHLQGFSTLGAGSVVPSVRHSSLLSYLTFLHV